MDFYKNPRKADRFDSFFFYAFIKKSSGNNPKFCIIVPKKVDRRSTKRNKTRRLLAENIKKFIQQDKSIDVLVRVRKIFDSGALKQLNDNITVFFDYINKKM